MRSDVYGFVAVVFCINGYDLKLAVVWILKRVEILREKSFFFKISWMSLRMPNWHFLFSLWDHTLLFFLILFANSVYFCIIVDSIELHEVHEAITILFIDVYATAFLLFEFIAWFNFWEFIDYFLFLLAWLIGWMSLFWHFHLLKYWIAL